MADDKQRADGGGDGPAQGPREEGAAEPAGGSPARAEGETAEEEAAGESAPLEGEGAPDGDGGEMAEPEEGPARPAVGEPLPWAAPRPARRGPSLRGLRWGTATAAYVLIVLFVLVAVNLVGSRLNLTWDLTANHQLTLTSASRKIIANLPQPVQIIAFEQPGDLTGVQVADLLKQYAADSNGKVTYRVVDPAADSALATRYNVTQYGTVVVASGTSTQSVTAADMTTYTAAGTAVFDGEGAITNAIIRAATPLQFTVDFLTGDGEPDVQTTLPDAWQALTNQGYTPGTLNLLSGTGVPKNVSTVAVIDPTHDLSTSEVNALKTYASNGGHMLFLLDPTTKPLANLDALLASWGVKPQNNLVLDDNHYSTDYTQILPTLTQAAITAPLQQAHLGVLLVEAQGLTVAKSQPGVTLTTFLTSTAGTSAGHPASWGVGDLAGMTASTSLQYDAKRDTAGPLDLGVMIVGTGSTGSSTAASSSTSTSSSSSSTSAGTGAPIGQQQFRAVVIGNAGFIASSSTGQPNGPINVQGNKDLFLNSVGWLTGRTEGIAVRPHAALNNQLLLNGGTTRALGYTFILGIPLVCFALAFSTWWSRRRL